MSHKKSTNKLDGWQIRYRKGVHGLKWNKQYGPELKFQNGKWVRSGK